MQKQIMIDPLSASSLFLETVCNGHPLGSATGFVVRKGQHHYLITNWHVVSGANPDTNEIMSKEGGIPDELRIFHHVTNKLGTWTKKSQPLYDESKNALWLEHPQGKKIDVVALPLDESDSTVALYSLDLSLADTDILVQPAMPVSIIGYPLGLATAGMWPIWKTGHIASDPDLNYDGRPAFLIDATTRGGMSGSPVVIRMAGGYPTRDGNYMLSSTVATKFLGVYSGRIHNESEIGKVWRPDVVSEILARTS